MHHSVKLWPECINSVHAVDALFFPAAHAASGRRRQSLLLCLLLLRLLLRLRPLRDTDATNERSDMPFRGLTPPTLERWRTPMAKAERERVLVFKNLSLSQSRCIGRDNRRLILFAGQCDKSQTNVNRAPGPK